MSIWTEIQMFLLEGVVRLQEKREICKYLYSHWA